MPKLSDFAISPKRLDDGVWWDFATMTTCKGNVPTPGSFLVRPLLGNHAYEAAVNDATTLHAATLRDPKVSEDVKRDIRRGIWARATAAHVLIGWHGWDDLGEYSEDLAADLLTDRRWLAVSEFIARAMSEQRAAYAREEESARGN